MLGEPAWIDSAQRGLDFIRAGMWRKGRLLVSCKDGKISEWRVNLKVTFVLN